MTRKTRLTTNGHEIPMHSLRESTPDKSALLYGRCIHCGRAAEYNPSAAERYGWDELFGPATRTECEGRE